MNAKFFSAPAIACVILFACSTLMKAAPEATFQTTITNGTTTITINYEHHPIRGANFQVLQQNASGNLVAEATVPEARTYLGTVVDYPGATACALKQPDETLWEYVIFEGGDQWWADNGVYTNSRGSATFIPVWPTASVVTPAQAAALKHVVAGDVIADIPYAAFITQHDSSVDHAVYVTEFCLMQTNLIYLRDLGFLYRIGRVVIRANQTQDPYQTGDKLETLRSQFGPFVGHEALKFVTVPGYGGGGAYVSTVGDWFSGASINDSDARGDAFIVWRHEVGHNQGAFDLVGGGCEGATLLNGNGVGRLSGPEEAAMIHARLTGFRYYDVSVLEDLGTYASFNLHPRASLDVAYCEVGLAVQIDVMGNDHDSNGDAITLQSFDAVSANGADITLSPGTGPDGRDELIYTGSAAYPVGLDSFQYRIKDPDGAESLGNVFVQMVPAELCAYWPMDENSGAVAGNAMGTGDLILENGASFAEGTINGAATFTPNQRAKAIVDVPETDTAVSMWFRTSQSDGGLYCAAVDSGGLDRNIYLNGGNVFARLWNEEAISSSGQNFADGQWHHLVHTYGGAAGGQKLYVDGVLVASGSKTMSDFHWQATIHIGYAPNPSADFFNGEIDDVRIWNRSLSADEAQALAQRSGTATGPHPVVPTIVAGDKIVLDWLAPSGATSHDLYFGASTDVLNATSELDGGNNPIWDEFMGSFGGLPLEVSNVDPGYYYWRVDELYVNTMFKGQTWAFQYLGATGDDDIEFADPTNWWVSTGGTFTQGGQLSGAGTFGKDGPGTLVLTGNNIHSGGTHVLGGTLQVGDGGITGTLGSGAVTVDGTLAYRRSDDVSHAGVLTGPGGLIQYGPGNLTLSGGGIDYTGTTIIEGGILTLQGTSSFDSAISVNSGLLALDATGADVLLPKPVTGVGPVEVDGDGSKRVRMLADNTYTGTTTIGADGILSLGNNTAAGSLAGAIVNDGQLILDRNNGWNFSNAVTGAGMLVVSSPAVTMDTATVDLGGDLFLHPNCDLNVESGAELNFAGGFIQPGNAYTGTMSHLNISGGSVSFGGLINDGWDGSYTINQTGGTVEAHGLTGGNGGGTWANNTYRLEGGTLTLGSAGIYGPFYKYPWFPSGGGLTLNLEFGGGTLSASDDWTTSKEVSLTGIGGDLKVDPATHAIGLYGLLSGTGGLEVTGSGTLRLTADNTYAGTTTIGADGILSLGNNTAAGSLAGGIVNDGQLILDRNSGWNFSNAVTGAGMLVVSSPAVTMDTATVDLGGDLFLHPNCDLNVESGAELNFAGGFIQPGNAYTGTMSHLNISGGSVSFGGLINDGWDGSYTINQTGGTVEAHGLTGGNGGGTWANNTYNFEGGTLILGGGGIYGPFNKWSWFPNGGGLTMNLNFGGGTLSASADWTSSWGVELTGTPGDLTVDPAGHLITINGAVTGSAGLDVVGSGTLVLAGDNSYSGTTDIAAGTGFGGAGGMTGPVNNSGTLSPGSGGAGELVVNNTLSMAPGSAIDWELTEWVAPLGLGYDSITVESLVLDATALDPITIFISNTELSYFVDEARTFVLLESTSSIAGFSADKFDLDTTGFTAGQGEWSLSLSGNQLVLDYGNFADSDGDGTADQLEENYYHTDPGVASTITTSLHADIPAHNYATATGYWNRDDAGTLTARARRGEITYTFDVAAGQEGIYEIELTGGAAGQVRPVEYLPLILSLNGTRLERATLPSVDGGSSVLTLLTPWLTEGTYSLGILHDNYHSRRQLRIDSLRINHVTGLEQRLANDNYLTSPPASSLTSPVCIEGVTTHLEGLTLTADSATVSAIASTGTSFYADVPLAEETPTAVVAAFQSGQQVENHSITWDPCNLAAHTALDIRAGDALRLDASDASHPSGTYTVELDGVPIADDQGGTTHTIGEPFVATFATAGSHTLTVTFNSDNATHNVTLVIHGASFGPSFSVEIDRTRTWTPPSLSDILLIEPDARLGWTETTPAGAPRRFQVAPTQSGPLHVLARLPGTLTGAPGAIVARGTVNAFALATIEQTGDPMIVTTYPDGTRLMRGTLVAMDLPADILIRLRTHYQGTVFADGSTEMWLGAEDFDENGIAYIYYERDGTGGTAMCTSVDLFVTTP